jgi:hypothetical protein
LHTGVSSACIHWGSPPTHPNTIPGDYSFCFAQYLSDLACFSADLSPLVTGVVDSEVLQAGELRAHLVAFVAAGVESSLGQSSGGQERIAVSPCP